MRCYVEVIKKLSPDKKFPQNSSNVIIQTSEKVFFTFPKKYLLNCLNSKQVTSKNVSIM